MHLINGTTPRTELTAEQQDAVVAALGFRVIDRPDNPQIQWVGSKGVRPALDPEVKMWRYIMSGGVGVAGEDAGAEED